MQCYCDCTPQEAREAIDEHKNLEKAIDEVKAGNMTQMKAAIVYGVPQSTIATRISKWKSETFYVKAINN